MIPGGSTAFPGDLRILLIKFDPDERPTHLQRHVPGCSCPGEWIKHNAGTRIGRYLLPATMDRHPGNVRRFSVAAMKLAYRPSANAVIVFYHAHQPSRPASVGIDERRAGHGDRAFYQLWRKASVMVFLDVSTAHQPDVDQVTTIQGGDRPHQIGGQVGLRLDVVSG